MTPTLSSSRARRVLGALAIVALLATGWIALRVHHAGDPGASSDLPADLSLEDLAGRSLFTNLGERLGKLTKEHSRQCRTDPARTTVLPSQIQWASSIDEAIERATREDKPILVLTFVRENGDPQCDV